MAAVPIPIEIPEGPRLTLAPEYPPGVPVPDPPIIVLGRDLHETWDHVYSVVKAIARPWLPTAPDGDVGRAIDLLVPVIEAFVGTSQKVLGGYINDVGEYAAGANWVVHNLLGQVIEWTRSNLEGLAGGLYGTLVHMNGLEAAIQATYALAYGAYDYAHDIAHEVGMDVEQWAMGHIYDPLMENLGDLNRALVRYIDAKAEAVIDGMTRYVNDALSDVGLEGAAALGLATAAAKWIEECGDPMCQTMGPNTDIGKFLKGLELAGILALLMEIGNMTQDDVEQRLRELAGEAQRIASAFEGTFVGGGGSLHDFALSLI